MVEGAQAHHLRGPLRVRPGELILIVDDDGQEHGVRIDAVERGRVTGRVVWSRPAAGEPDLRVEVLQALVRDVDEAVAALAEAGAASIRPVVTRRSVSRPDPERAAVRLRRWREIAREAAGLAHRAAVPTVHPVADLDRGVGGLPPGSRILACTLDAAAPMARVEVELARGLGVSRSVLQSVLPAGGLTVRRA